MIWKKRKKKKPDDLQCFEDLIALIYEDLFRFIYSIAKEQTAAEDALQNALLAAYKNFDSLQDKSKFKSWMFTIARRETLSLIKKSKREIPSEGAGLEVVLNSNEEFVLPEELLLTQELREVIVKAINDLKPEMREIVTLRYYKEMSFEEIAYVLNTNVNTVRTRHMRAKNKINKYLKENYFHSLEIETNERKETV